MKFPHRETWTRTCDRRPYVLCIMCVLLIAFIPDAQAADAQSANAATTKELWTKNPNMQVCKRVHVTGTHFRKRICHTRAQWKAFEEEAQEALRILDSHARNSSSGSATRSLY